MDKIEQNLIGMIFHRPEIVAEIAGIINLDDFSDRTAAILFKMAQESFTSGKPFDSALAGARHPEMIQYIIDSLDIIPMGYKGYAAEISNTARKKRLIDGMGKIMRLNGQSTADDVLHELGNLHLSEISGGKKSYDITSVTSRVQKEIAENQAAGKMPGVDTGFDFLYQNYVRYVPGHIWVITGYTSVGKSKLLIEKVRRAGKAKMLIISTEMSEAQILTRLYARQTGINENRIMSGKYNESESLSISKAVTDTANMNLKIVDDIYELTDIEAIIQQESMAGGVDIVFLDYVQNCSVKGTPRREQGHEMAIRLQQLAKTAKTCLVCFSQVSNSVGRGDVDQFEAKGAGEWAAVADVGVRLKRSKENAHLLLYDMQKGRHYRTMEQKLQFADNYTSIFEI